MNINDKVRLTKVEAFSNSDKDALSVSYWLEGYLIAPIKVGNIINVWRIIRNGISVTGIFTSSPVVKIEGNNIYTKNSIWRVELLEEAKHNNNVRDIKF